MMSFPGPESTSPSVGRGPQSRVLVVWYAGQSVSRCATSSTSPQFAQSGLETMFIRCRVALTREQYPVRSCASVDCSHLLRSSCPGVGCGCGCRPALASAIWLVRCRIAVRALLKSIGAVAWSHVSAARFAMRSAASFPSRPACPGTHCSIILHLLSVRVDRRVHTSCARAIC